MFGCPRQKTKGEVHFVANISAASLTFEEPISSGFSVEIGDIYQDMGDNESLDVPLSADTASECGGDAKPVKGLSRFHCGDRCRAPTIPSCHGQPFTLSGLLVDFRTEAKAMFCSFSQCARRTVRSSPRMAYDSSPRAAITRPQSSLI